VAQTYPVDIVRKIDRRWERLFKVATPNATQNGDRFCRVCKNNSSISCLVTEDCVNGLSQHDWLCPTCSFELVTTRQRPAS
jgi:hypothetical protein